MPKTGLMRRGEPGRAILRLRGYHVMLDADLALLYGVPTKALLQAVKRNISRFPPDSCSGLGALRLRS